MLPTEFKSKKKMLHRGHGLGSGNQGKPNRALSEALAAAGNRVPPSIPTRFQSYGYEVTDAGDLQLQEPLYPVYQGSGDSAVGPGDYEPKDTIRFKKAPTAQFGKVCIVHTSNLRHAAATDFFNVRALFIYFEIGFI